MLYTVTDVLRACYYVSLLFTCLHWFCLCYILRSYVTSNIHPVRGSTSS